MECCLPPSLVGGPVVICYLLTPGSAGGAGGAGGLYTDTPDWLSDCQVDKMLTGQLADKQLAVSQVADWITRGLVNSPTTHLKKHGITVLYLYVKPNSNPNTDPIEYWGLQMIRANS